MLSLAPLDFDAIAPTIRPGDLLLSIDPLRAAALPPALRRPPGWRTSVLEWLESLAARLPLVNRVSGAAARSDYNAVHVMTVYDHRPHIVIYYPYDSKTNSYVFCMIDAREYLGSRGVSRIAVRPLYAPGVRGDDGLARAIAQVVEAINDVKPTPTILAARTDDVLLVSELYCRLTSANLAGELATSGPRPSVARLFAAGGVIDDLFASLSTPFLLGPEVCGIVARGE